MITVVVKGTVWYCYGGLAYQAGSILAIIRGCIPNAIRVGIQKNIAVCRDL
jgi:hypothetical protein